jgi:phosphate:Na+ symporter
MEVFTLIYTVIGGLGLFFYGMKSMSDALQAVAGDVIKNCISAITKNRFLAVAVGMIVTVLVQSSTITSVMTVGLVNANLMTLTQAIGVIFGVNIGTTITGWIISIKVGKYGLLLIGLGIFPLLFGKGQKTRQAGRALFGIGLVFYGLLLMSDGFRPLRDMPAFLEAISYFSGQHYGAYFASVVVGCLLTMIVQSSSAMLGVTIALAMTGVIPFHTAAALVMGENIGTTITAALASVGGNKNAKRIALAHSIFNTLGVLVLFMLFPYYIQLIEMMTPGDPYLRDASGEFPYVAVHIATGHTLFNVCATLIFLPFVKQIKNLVTWVIPDAPNKETPHLVMLGEPHETLPATALTLVKAELDKMKEIVDKMMGLAQSYLNLDNQQGNQGATETLTKIKNYEAITDNIQKEILVYLVKLQQRRLTEDQSNEAQSYMQMADEYESIADYIEKLVFYASKEKLNDLLRGEAKAEFFNYFNEVHAYYQETTRHLSKATPIDMSYVNRRSEQLRITSELIRENHLTRVSNGEYKALGALTFSDMIVALRKIRSHTKHFGDAYSRISK